MSEEVRRTKMGRTLTPEELDAIADEVATTSTDVEPLRSRRRGRPLTGAAPGEVVTVRMEPKLRGALHALASSQGQSVSAIIRDAVEQLVVAAQQSDGRLSDAELGRSVRNLAEQWVTYWQRVESVEQKRDLEERVPGFRIVAGGQTDSDGSWEITDAESGELLAEGVGLQSFEAALQDSWYSSDSLGWEAFGTVRQPSDRCGLPESLAEQLSHWVSENHDDAVAFVSRPVHRPEVLTTRRED